MEIPVVQLIISIVIIGLVLYLINKYVPMQSAVKTILNVVIILILLLYVLKMFKIY